MNTGRSARSCRTSSPEPIRTPRDRAEAPSVCAAPSPRSELRSARPGFRSPTIAASAKRGRQQAGRGLVPIAERSASAQLASSCERMPPSATVSEERGPRGRVAVAAGVRVTSTAHGGPRDRAPISRAATTRPPHTHTARRAIAQRWSGGSGVACRIPPTARAPGPRSLVYRAARMEDRCNPGSWKTTLVGNGDFRSSR